MSSPWTVEALKNALGRMSLGGLIGYAVIRSLVAATWKPFWADEISTYLVVNHPQTRSIITCLRTGADGQPPFFFAIEKLFSHLPFSREISLRIPSVLAFCFTLICVYGFVRRRNKRIIALGCAASLFLTAVFWVYAIEARPYALMTAATAAALVCYQRAGSRLWNVLLGLSLVFGEAIHYYMVFVTLAFGLAEFAYVLKERSIRVGIWVGFSASAVPLIICWPLIATVKKLYGSHFWAVPSIRNLFETYSISFDTLRFGPILCFGLIGCAVLALFLKEDAAGEAATSTPLYCERLAVVGLAALPFIECAAAKLTNGGYTGRYALPLTLAVPGTLSYYIEYFQVRKLNRVLIAAPLFAILVLGVLREGYFWRDRIIHPTKTTFSAERVEDFVEPRVNSGMPIAVSSPLEYFQLFYYAESSWKDRFVYLVDFDSAIRYSGSHSDTADRNLSANELCDSSIRAVKFDGFVKQYDNFLLYVERPDEGNQWLPRALRDKGYQLTTVADNKWQVLYMVQSKGDGK